jgi:hypothetical protein
MTGIFLGNALCQVVCVPLEQDVPEKSTPWLCLNGVPTSVRVCCWGTYPTLNHCVKKVIVSKMQSLQKKGNLRLVEGG